MSLDDHLRQCVTAAVKAALAEIREELEPLAYTEEKAAELIGVHAHQLRDARLRGEIAASKVGRSIVYRREDLRTYLNERRLPCN